MRSSDRAWRRWGEIDPYFAVLTEAQYRSETIADNKEEFFASGERHVEMLLQTIDRHFGSAPRGRALDFGCGVGRLVLPLARHYSEAVGVDIAPAMLAEARSNAVAAGLANAQFVLSDDELSAVSGRFDLVHTVIVLQHIPVQAGLDYMRRMLSLLNPRGIASFHFTVDCRRGGLRTALNWAQKKLPLVHNAANFARGRPWSEPMMQMNEYSPLEVMKLFEACEITSPHVAFLCPEGDILGVQLVGQKTG